MKWLMVAMSLSAATACTPEAHRIPPPYPYEGETYSAPEIEAIAAEWCKTVSGGQLPPNKFSTDGCTMWPDGNYRECCIKHDLQYWCAGPSTLRVAADRELRACVAERSNNFDGSVTYLGSRLGGGRLMPFPWRWGYGYPYPYAPPPDDAGAAGQQP